MVIVACSSEYWEFVRKLRMDGRVIDVNVMEDPTYRVLGAEAKVN